MNNKLLKSIFICTLATLPTLNTVYAENIETGTSKLKSYNVRVNPIGLLLGIYSANFDIGVTDALTIGPFGSFLSTNIGGVGVAGGGGGIEAKYYFNGQRLTSGLYLSPSVEYVSVAVNDQYSSRGVNASGISATATMGYQWVTDSGFNFQIGLGARYSTLAASVSNNGHSDAIPNAVSGLTLAGDLDIGFAF